MCTDIDATMKAATFEIIDDDSITKELNRPSMFKNRTRHLINDDIESSANPYLLMLPNKDIRVSKPLTNSQINNMVMVEAKRLVMNEKISALKLKREEEYMDMELKRFQNKLYSSRPKFSEPSQKFSKNQTFNHIILPIKTEIEEKETMKVEEVVEDDKNDKNGLMNDYDQISEKNESTVSSGSITVVIKDKPITEAPKRNLELIRRVFNSWRMYVVREKRLMEIKIRIQRTIVTMKLKRCFNLWRSKVTQSRELMAKKKEECERKDIEKIESFVKMIKEKQRTMKKIAEMRTTERDEMSDKKKTSGIVANRKKLHKNISHSAEPLNNRLEAQKKIIAQQRIKLVEQNRLIEDMKLKQIEIESRLSKMETVNIAKTILNNCGVSSRRALMTHIIQKNENDKSSNTPLSTFPQRLAARATERLEKIRQRQIANEKRIYEEKLKEEAEKIEEEKNRKQQQREAERQAKLLREEKEKKKAELAERNRILNEMADNFYRKYLLRKYFIRPLRAQIQRNHQNMIIAIKHYNHMLLKKTFNAWRDEIKRQYEIKIELAIYTHNRNIQARCFNHWREVTKNETRKYQVACDLYNLRLRERYFKIWREAMMKQRMKNIENEKKAVDFYQRMMKKKYFLQWKKYMEISDCVKESDKCKDQLRELVQVIIPDFAPKHRGVIIDD